ncbi:hypothetical protein B6D52_02160 [Candidatus Parcubacteria bacterium 4484_255]|nr:MAG: hypothetical protein B6D52_02160 [Candidatus Parcubacteria bacterium 4484_255]
MFYRFLKDLLIVSAICFFSLCIIEDFQPGFVSFWFDIRIVLYIALLSGFLVLLNEFAFKLKK